MVWAFPRCPEPYHHHHPSLQAWSFTCFKRLPQKNNSTTTVLHFLVKIRFPPFLKLSYALERSFYAELNSVCGFKNDQVMVELCWNEHWWFKLVLHITWWIARFSGNHGWIHVVCCLLIISIYAIAFFWRKLVESNLRRVECWYCACKTLTFKMPCPEFSTSFARYLALVHWPIKTFYFHGKNDRVWLSGPRNYKNAIRSLINQLIHLIFNFYFI